MSKRLIALAASALLIGGVVVGTPARVRAGSTNVYVGFNAHTTGGSCANPDFTVTGTADSAQILLAIAATNEGGTLHFCAGTYDIDEQLDLNGTNISFSGAGAARTILDGGATWLNGAYQSGGVNMITNFNNLTVRKLTMTHGNAAIAAGELGSVIAIDANFTYNSGPNGAAISAGGTLEVNRCTFTGNSVSGNGGAIVSEGDILITASTFTNNSAVGGGGAAGSNTRVTVTESEFTGNTAGDGGAIAAGTSVAVTNSTFESNVATNVGGAIRADTTATVRASTFKSNTAANGGAIGVAMAATVSNSTFISNTSSTQGGAIYADTSATVSNSTFTGNTTTYFGGAILANTLATVRGSTFTRNTSANFGGAVASATGAISRSSFTKNTAADRGGAVLFWAPSDPTATVSRSTFVKNYAATNGAAISVGLCQVANLSTVNKMLRANTFTGNKSGGDNKNVERWTNLESC
jgi:predicted outer membrane repeat protein